MLSYLIRRLLLLIPTMIGATALIFFVMELSPVSVTNTLLSREGNVLPGARKAREEYLNRRYGLNNPPVVRYFKWLNGISPVGVKEAGEGFPGAWRFGFKTPDLGDSFPQSKKVSEIILDALPVTLLLQAISIPIAYGIAIWTGIFTARHRGKIQDIATGSGLLALWSLPVIWVSVMLIGFFANKHYFPWFPTGELHEPQSTEWTFLPGNGTRGWLLDTAWHLILPVVCLTYANFAYLSKLTRAALLDTLGADFVRTARAKGLGERVVLYRHAFRNSLLPLITVFASLLPVMITGSVVVEKVFSINGTGRMIIDSMLAKDTELFLSVSTITLLLQLVGYLLADFAYVLADPRVSYE
ncbi:MAG: ABC transporter permease [Phycisphaerae bacterium]|nr:ABC transporter permease [Tepidisphaeraceae bacterium]